MYYVFCVGKKEKNNKARHRTDFEADLWPEIKPGPFFGLFSELERGLSRHNDPPRHENKKKAQSWKG